MLAVLVILLVDPVGERVHRGPEPEGVELLEAA
jgi:hypothetical protein